MARTEVPVTVVPAVVIRPGDKVLLSFHTDNHDRVHRILATLQERYPEVEFIAVSAGVNVMPPGGDQS